MNSTYKKGFTLIELLVVIAIIGILTAVVLASLNIARAKGANAAVKSNMQGLRGQAELIYDANAGNYTVGLCSDTKVVEILNAASVAGSGVDTDDVCDSADTYWVASAPLKDPGGTFWCVDNTGKAKEVGAAIIIGTDTSCP